MNTIAGSAPLASYAQKPLKNLSPESKGSLPAVEVRDRATLSPAPARVHSLPALQAANLLTSQSSLHGPIGAVLSDAMRQELKVVVERLQQSGVKFEYRRRFALPWVRPHRVELTAPEAVEQIARITAQDLDRVEFTLPGAPRRGLQWLMDLQLLDGLRGAGEQVLSPDQVVAASAARALRSNGATFYTNQYSERRRPARILDRVQDELEAMRGLQDNARVYVTTGKGESFTVNTPDQLAAVEFFHGSGQDCGLKEAELARNLKAAGDRGMTFYLDSDARSPYSVYTSDSTEFCAGWKGVPAVPVDRRELRDLPALQARLEDYALVYRSILKGPCDLAGWNGTRFPPGMLEASSKFGMTVAAAVCAELIRASAEGGKDRNSWERVGELSKMLFESSSTPFELARKTSLAADEYARHGYCSAHRFLSDVREAVGHRSHDPKQQSEFEELFMRLLRSTGSIRCAVDGVDLVRIAIGSETQEQRVRLFTDLAARQSESTLAETANCYRSVLAERATNEGLIATGQRMARVLEACSVGRHHGRAVEVFRAVQEGLREDRFDSQGADRIVVQFASHLALSEDVDKALDALLTGNIAMGSVAEKEDFVIIGGVRVRRK